MDLIKKAITENSTRVILNGNGHKGLSKGNPVIIVCNELPEIKDEAIKRRLVQWI